MTGGHWYKVLKIKGMIIIKDFGSDKEGQD